tara:strand:+ start:472 stop:837 length:366 start_codon:yes stop_codon:yes gene_type:complete
MTAAETCETINFKDAVYMNEKGRSAIVVRGIGEWENIDEWIDGINGDLVEDKIFVSPMTEIYLLPTNKEGRTDVVMVYGNEHRPAMGKFAMWRLGWAGRISWLEDYIVNDVDVQIEREPND